jgi:pyruvate/2-oxoglutarate dehydrogenase complex dihydrolipoamide acyltransferase (E2) component
VLSQLIDQLRMPTAPATVHRYGRLHNFILDALVEGRRKPLAHLLFEVDVAKTRERLREHQRRTGETISMTSYVAKSFASAIETDKRMQGYRLGRSRLVVFDDVDLTFVIEREWEGEALPVFHIVRRAHQKSASDIQQELRRAKEAPLGCEGPLTALEMRFFQLPRFLRRPLWLLIRRNPYWFKDVAGTAAVASIGMFTSGASVGVSISPTTLTLVIGSIEKKLVPQDGQVVESEVIHLNLTVDHAVINGAPLVRFVDRFKTILQDGTALTPAADRSSR